MCKIWTTLLATENLHRSCNSVFCNPSINGNWVRSSACIKLMWRSVSLSCSSIIRLSSPNSCILFPVNFTHTLWSTSSSNLIFFASGAGVTMDGTICFLDAGFLSAAVLLLIDKSFLALSVRSLVPCSVIVQGISRPPCTKSLEYLRCGFVTLQDIDPPSKINREQVELIFFGKCLTVIPAFVTFIAKGSWGFPSSRKHESISSITGTHTSW